MLPGKVSTLCYRATVIGLSVVMLLQGNMAIAVSTPHVDNNASHVAQGSPHITHRVKAKVSQRQSRPVKATTASSDQAQPGYKGSQANNDVYKPL